MKIILFLLIPLIVFQIITLIYVIYFLKGGVNNDKNIY